MCVCICVCVCLCVYMCVCVYVCAFACVCVCTVYVHCVYRVRVSHTPVSQNNDCAIYCEVVVTSISAGLQPMVCDHFSSNCLHNDQDKLAYLIKQS